MKMNHQLFYCLKIAGNNLQSFILLCLVCLFTLGRESQATKRKVLFIGNSYVTVNNLPLMVAQVATSMGDTLVFDMNAPGGFTLANHFGNATTRAKIAQGGWDLVVIQAQSQEPAFPDGQVASQTLPFARKLDSLIHAVDSCTETQFYLTWGRKNGDAGNCGFYPPICTFSGMQDKLTQRYLQMALQAKGSVAPVGEAWRMFRAGHPTIELYNPDQSHPVVTGTYLAALVFYQSLFQKDLRTTVFKPAGIADSTAIFMRTTATNVVKDSARKWFQHGRLAKAAYGYSVSGSTITFNNQSYAGNRFEWTFGDGTQSTDPSPVHSYNSNGNYPVRLTVFNGCRKDTLTKTISVTTVAVRPSLLTSGVKVFPNPFQDELHVENPDEIGTTFLVNGQGKKKIREWNGRGTLHTSDLSIGLYFLQLQMKDGSTIHTPIVKIR